MAVQMKPIIDELLRQGMRERSDWSDTREKLLDVSGRIETLRETLGKSRDDAELKAAS